MQVTFIRHLPTEWNEKTLLQGKRDIRISPITLEMENEISRNQQYLQVLSPFDMVLASTLKRTHETAKLYGYSCETESLLDELDFGPFEGRPKKELIEKYAEEWVHLPDKLILGEPVKNLEERIKMFINKYQNFKNILVFGHGSWIRAIASYNKWGHINCMNQITVKNNECITMNFNVDQ